MLGHKKKEISNMCAVAEISILKAPIPALVEMNNLK